VAKLGLHLNSNNAVVLAGVDGCLNSGTVTAVMGPSGAGKTTFLNALSGRASYGRTTGKIFINGKDSSVLSISRLVGFVPQVKRTHIYQHACMYLGDSHVWGDCKFGRMLGSRRSCMTCLRSLIGSQAHSRCRPRTMHRELTLALSLLPAPL
jgi:ABC-type phosphate/phosphonate transport system ATPase subunit